MPGSVKQSKKVRILDDPVVSPSKSRASSATDKAVKIRRNYTLRSYLKGSSASSAKHIGLLVKPTVVSKMPVSNPAVHGPDSACLSARSLKRSAPQDELDAEDDCPPQPNSLPRPCLKASAQSCDAEQMCSDRTLVRMSHPFVRDSCVWDGRAILELEKNPLMERISALRATLRERDQEKMALTERQLELEAHIASLSLDLGNSTRPSKRQKLAIDSQTEIDLNLELQHSKEELKLAVKDANRLRGDVARMEYELTLAHEENEELRGDLAALLMRSKWSDRVEELETLRSENAGLKERIGESERRAAALRGLVRKKADERIAAMEVELDEALVEMDGWVALALVLPAGFSMPPLHADRKATLLKRDCDFLLASGSLD